MTQLHGKRYLRAFTLVEVVVVIVIIGILAVVAIPQYQAYMLQTRQDAIDNIADGAAAMASNFYRRTGTDPIVSDLKLNLDASKFTLSIANPNVIVNEVGHSPNKTSTRAYR